MPKPTPSSDESLDQAIETALAREDRELLERISGDAGHIEQSLLLFRGRTAWVNGVVFVSQAVLFAGGIWSGWNFFQAETALSALHWGLPSAVLLIMSLMLKLALWPVMQSNRVLVAIKRLEVMFAQNAGQA